ncbi:two-component system, chemotaxis family, sensor kinase CheA [Papillibacter cinnamivorans DSM 12816]|uniref:Chemotaxis protein CheA n=2 Tax=Papillibacter TaxID=100175 RepID=A0A1W1YEU9_9FIRM|nr:two-component system, chemotaxis family, sensor kinase CheA [Papillibacter cinnamivorans DSM 12816]
MLDIYIYENEQLLEKLENLMLIGEREKSLSAPQIDEVFRIMHTIKGSSSMMSFDNLFHLTHSAEDLFSQIRDGGGRCDDWSEVFDIVLSTIDFIKTELVKIQSGQACDGDPAALIGRMESLVHAPQQETQTEKTSGEQPEAGSVPPAAEAVPAHCPIYKIKVKFEPDCKMEHIRALGIAASLGPLCPGISHVPENLDGEEACAEIVEKGFLLYVQTFENPDKLKRLLETTLFVQNFSVIPLEADNEELPESMREAKETKSAGENKAAAAASPAESGAKQNFISVNVNKLDSLMDLVGELVTTEAMVTRNPDLAGLHLSNFEAAVRQLRSLTSELQSIVMSVRMLPVSTVFHKMQRIARDTSKKIGKDVNLVLVGEETEVDKNIIDSLSDPLMHLIRNSIDHGIEDAGERAAAGKPGQGQVTLEAKNIGEDVIILVSDDGQGLDRDKILKKAKEKGLLFRPEGELTDKEIFNFIFLPGFSTKDSVSGISGRGVGMDVVRKSIEKLGGSVSVDSEIGKGTTISIRIPLTLAIIDGMHLSVGETDYIVPLISIREFFVPDMKNVFLDTEGNEMILVRGECYSILRLYEFFHIQSDVRELTDGILVMIESERKTFCILVDHIIGEQQVVVKPLPEYVQKTAKNLNGISGCTILGDGRISLILNVNNLTAVN